MFRKTLFWLHLSSGVIAGLIVLMMSVTGVILTYERQILAWQDRAYFIEPAQGQTRLTVEELIASGSDDSFQPTSIALYNDPASPAVLRAGRSGSRHLNAFTGEVIPPRGQALDNFFSTMTGWHRWFNVSGDGRGTARDITGAANLLFLFMIVSGLYLWLPSIYRRSTMRLRLWFHPNAKDGAARDFNWHHVFGFWFAIPLIVVVATATVFNYSWANNLVYQLAGEAPPQRGGSAASSEATAPQPAPTGTPLAYQELFAIAGAQVDDYRLLTMTIPDSAATTAEFSIDQGNGGEPQKRHSVTLDTYDGSVVEWAPFNSQSAGRQARSWVRFLHTGEALGLVGQTIAGLASLAGVLLTYTGLALCLRRFRNWLRRLKKSSMDSSTAGASANS